MTRPLRVFLCHASQDKPAVRELYKRLKTEDWIDPWLDEEKLSLGQHWTTVIEDALHDADVVIIFLSSYSVKKEGFIQRELNYAWEISLEKPREAIFLIPFRLDDCQIPRYLSARQWGDYFGDKKESTYQVLLRSLKQRHLQKLQLEATENEEREKAVAEAKLKAERVANVKAKLVAEQKTQQESFENTEKIAREEFEREKTEREAKAREKSLQEKKRSSPSIFSRVRPRYIAVGGIFIVGILCFIFGANYLIQNFLVQSTPTEQISITSTESPSETQDFFAVNAPTFTPVPGLGSTMVGEDGMTLLYVPAGEFIMGSEEGGDNEKPVHVVYLDAYWIDQTEVTNSMYAQCVQQRMCNPPSSITSFTRTSYYDNSEFKDYPVIYVSWEDAQSYCSWANRRLPTEAEWEKAARGTNAFQYPWGDSRPDSTFLNYYDGDVGDTSKVGSYPKGASPFGALDMAGNVAEWVADLYRDFYYLESPSDNPLGPENGEARVVRGGAWEDATLACGNFYSTGYTCINNPSIENYSTWKRDYDGQRATKHYYGFRCAVSP